MYAIVHKGQAYSTNGIITDVEGTPLGAENADSYNKQLEAQELEHIKSGPERLMLYVREPKGGKCAVVITWLGTEVGNAWLGSKAYVGWYSWSHRTYRRAITVRIFGVLYHGWFFQSGGDYCRLKRAKRQNSKYAASFSL